MHREMEVKVLGLPVPTPTAFSHFLSCDAPGMGRLSGGGVFQWVLEDAQEFIEWRLGRKAPLL